MCKKTVGRGGMFSLFDFGSPYSRDDVAYGFFSLKLASFVIFLVSSKLLTNLLTSLVVDTGGLVLRCLQVF